jgi:hypothetical protein
MIYYHNFQIELHQYAERGRGNVFPEIDCCPMCRAQNRLQRHGFYERNAIENNTVVRIPICRLKCPDCGKTISLLPVFLLPYFQSTMAFIVQLLLSVWLLRPLQVSRQLRRFYMRRFRVKQTDIALFIRESGDRQPCEVFPDREAIRLLERIRARDPAAFAWQWWRHRLSSFMAAADYRGARVVPSF